MIATRSDPWAGHWRAWVSTHGSRPRRRRSYHPPPLRLLDGLFRQLAEETLYHFALLLLGQ